MIYLCLRSLTWFCVDWPAFNFKAHIPSDIATHGQYLPIQNVQSQEYLENVSKWTKSKQMCLNKKKSNFMLFNKKIPVQYKNPPR